MASGYFQENVVVLSEQRKKKEKSAPSGTTVQEVRGELPKEFFERPMSVNLDEEYEYMRCQETCCHPNTPKDVDEIGRNILNKADPLQTLRE